jgi:hypothetical protein
MQFDWGKANSATVEHAGTDSNAGFAPWIVQPAEAEFKPEITHSSGIAERAQKLDHSAGISEAAQKLDHSAVKLGPGAGISDAAVKLDGMAGLSGLTHLFGGMY